MQTYTGLFLCSHSTSLPLSLLSLQSLYHFYDICLLKQLLYPGHTLVLFGFPFFFLRCQLFLVRCLVWTQEFFLGIDFTFQPTYFLHRYFEVISPEISLWLEFSCPPRWKCPPSYSKKQSTLFQMCFKYQTYFYVSSANRKQVRFFLRSGFIFPYFIIFLKSSSLCISSSGRFSYCSRPYSGRFSYCSRPYCCFF